MTTTQKIKRYALQAAQFLVMLALSLIAMDALAQTIQLGDLQAAAEGPPEDAAMRMLKGLLGEEFASVNPMSAAGLPATLIGDIFAIFNGIVFTIGALWLGYVLIMSIATSAQDGEPLGKNTSTLWAPIRIGTGIFGMLPVVGGFSLFQAIMMSFIVLGIGAGNIVARKAIDATAAFKAITPSYSSIGAAPNLSTDVQTVVRGAVMAELCHNGQLYFSDLFHGTMTAPPPRVVGYQDKKRAGFDYGPCGKIEVTRRERNITGGRADELIQSGTEIRGESKASFRNYGVDYDAIANAVHRSAILELRLIRQEAEDIAREWFSQYARAQDGQPVDMMAASLRVYDRSVALEKSARSRLNNSIGEAANADTEAIEAGVLQHMRDGGWMRLGDFYSVYAESSAAIADAQRAFQLSFKPGIELERVMSGGSTQHAWSEPLRRFIEIAVSNEPADEKGLIDLAMDYMHLSENEMGERSVGQSITNMLIGFTANNSGGAGLVNPVIASKNLGDWLMVAGQTGIAGGSILEALPAGKGIAIAKKFSGTLDKLGDLLMIICYAMIGLGMFLSIFIPMSLWATWFSAILIYLTSMLEGLIYAQLAAFSHIKAEGDRFVEAGSSGAKFYIYLLNALFRPAVMVISFVLASALMTFAGTFLIEGFSTAMASAQGNSLTGLLSIIGYLILFCVVLFGLVQTCASLVIDIPDRLLGWVGGVAENNRGTVIGAAAGTAMRGVKGPAGGGASGARAAASTVKPKSS